MNHIIYEALCACLGLQPSSEEAAVLFRQSYGDPEPPPRAPRNTDAVYWSLSPDPYAPEPPPGYSAENAAGSSHDAAVSSFSAWTLQVVCYGPHALVNARKIRAFLFVDGAGMPRYILRKAGIRPVPDPPEPMLLHEPEGSLWRERADLTVSLRAGEKETHPARQNAIHTAPAVIIHSGGI